MNCNWPVFTVAELIEQGMLEPPMDGNHGAIHPKTSDYVTEGVPFIMANDFRPENFRIGPLVGNAPRTKKSVLTRHQPLPLIAEFTDGEIQIYSI